MPAMCSERGRAGVPATASASKTRADFENAFTLVSRTSVSRRPAAMSLFSRIEASAASSLLRREAKPRGPPSSFGTTYVTAAGSHGAAAEIEQGIAPVAERIFDVVAENAQRHEIGDEMQRRAVQELVRDESRYAVERPGARRQLPKLRREERPLPLRAMR